MAILLDTHAFLWFVAGDSHLPANVKSKIEDINEACYISIASFWEITIKVGLGKLKLEIPLQELFDFTERNQMEVIQITPDHLLALLELPDHHADPFDRLIVAQAISEELVLVSGDKNLKKYKVKYQWKESK